MKAIGVLVALACLCAVADCWAGANAGGRAWVSWDRSGLVTNLCEVTFQRRDVFVHIENASDMTALAVHLMYSVEGDTSASLVSADEDTQSGWAEHSTEASSFYGDSTYDWTIQFPDGAPERAKVKYALESTGAADTLRGSVWLTAVIVQDSAAQLDTLSLGPTARILGTSAPTFAVPTDSLPGLVIVEFAPGTVAGGHTHIFAGDILEPTLRDSLSGGAGFTIGQRVFPSAPEGVTIRTSLTGEEITCPDLSRTFVMKVDDYVSVADQLQRLATLPGVVHVNPVSALVAHRTPLDTFYDEQWHLAPSGAAAIGAPQAWDVTIGAPPLLICIIDSGIDYNHTDEFGPFNNSRILRGRDFGDSDYDVMDDTPPGDRGHGTSVAGIVGALTDNGVGVSGVMWTGRMLIHKTSDQYGVCPLACFSYHPSYAVAAAVDDAVEHGAQAINMSIGYPFSVPSIQDLLFTVWRRLHEGEPLAVSTYTAYRLGVLVTASAGNGGGDEIGDPSLDLPAAFPWVMGVGASEIIGSRTSFSNYGPRLDLLAPGQDITTTHMLEFGGYDHNFGGTSASSPTTAGSAALVIGESINRSLGLSNEDVMQLLMRSSRDVLVTGLGRDDDTGWGHLDVSRALARLRMPYQFSRASLQGGTATMIADLHKCNFIGNGGLPGGEYWVRKYEVRQHVDFCGALSEVPMMWSRTRDSQGWSAANPNGELPYSHVENVTQTGFDAVSYVYWVEYDISGGVHFRGWWPCPPAQATMAYSASTRSVLSAATIAGPHVDCSSTWGVTTCGGDSAFVYAWYERPPGGAWSSVVATTPTYSRYLPGSDLELRVVVGSGAAAIADTHYVNYRQCVVDAGHAPVPPTLSFSASPNPARSSTSLNLSIPSQQAVEVSIYDITGRRVATPFKGVLSPGVHQIPWTGQAERTMVGAGLYFARLSSPSGDRKVRLVFLP